MSDFGVRIKYGNFAPEAKENFSAKTSDQLFDTLRQLKEYNLVFPNYGNPCELYQTLLDGAALPLPDGEKDKMIGLWSKQISDENGVFSEPIVLEMTADEKYSSQAISLAFDTQNETFATRVDIEWYSGEDLISKKTFAPTSAEYSCENQVEGYDKIILTFRSINMPYNRLRLRAVDHGYGLWFEPKNLRNVKLIQELNAISTEISVSTADFVLDIESDRQLLFQKNQPLSVYFNGELKATTFLKSFKRRSKNLWNISAEDHIGFLEDVPFKGGVYFGEVASKIIDEIFRTSNTPYKIDGDLAGEVLSGYIPYTNCREALMQVAFAIGASISTANSDCVNVFKPSDKVTQSIPKERIMIGQYFDEENEITNIEIVAHSYEPSESIAEAYKASESGAGENVFVRFREPLHDLAITSGSQILESGANYAIINATEDCVLSGKRYNHTTVTKTMTNLDSVSRNLDKTVVVENATLVSANNVDFLLERCYNYFKAKSTINTKIVDGKHVVGGDYYQYGSAAKYGAVKYKEKSPKVVTYDTPTTVGDMIELETEYLGKVTGRIIKQSFNLNGGIAIKESIVR